MPGGPPENFTVDVISTTEILLMWQPPPREIQNGRVRLYTVTVFEVQTYNNYTVTSEDPPLQVESLHPYYNYVCSVTAVTIGPGPYTSSLTVRTFEDGEFITINPVTLHVHDMASSEISSNHMYVVANTLHSFGMKKKICGLLHFLTCSVFYFNLQLPVVHLRGFQLLHLTLEQSRSAGINLYLRNRMASYKFM